jgi:hypothetical protein
MKACSGTAVPSRILSRESKKPKCVPPIKGADAPDPGPKAREYPITLQVMETEASVEKDIIMVVTTAVSETNPPSAMERSGRAATEEAQEGEGLLVAAAS